MLGNNPIAGSRIASEGFKVHSIWYTLQGEGPFVGCPAIFVRLAGCNLRCFWCDTDFEHGTVRTSDDLAARINTFTKASGCRFVVLTGGEPLLQPIKELIDHPSMADFSFQIETAGSYWPIGSLLPTSRLSIVCSPKTGNIVSALRSTDLCSVYWKYIVRTVERVDGNDGLPIKSTQKEGRDMRLFRPINLQDPKIKSRIFVQGCDEGDNAKTRANVEYATSIALQYGYRLSLQTHKILGLD